MLYLDSHIFLLYASCQTVTHYIYLLSIIHILLILMYATFHGNTCIRLQEKTQTRDLTVLIDPYTPGKTQVPGIGAGDIVLATRGARDLKGISGDPFIITGPGEYEIKEVMIRGVAHAGGTIYRFDIANVRFLHVGLLTEPLSDALIGDFGNIDVLFVPVGGEDTLKPHQAVALTQDVQPRMVIPMAFSVDGLDTTHGPLQPFLKELGQQEATHEEKYKFIKKNLPEEDMQVIILDPPS